MNLTSAISLRIVSARLHDPMKMSPLTVVLWGSLFLMTAARPSLAAAPITQSGLNTQVGPAVTLPSGQTQYNITGGTRPGGAAGTNLFHSFGNFNVPTNNIANFLNAGSVDSAGNPLAAGVPTSNILGRVTSGNPSAIFGTIQTNGPGGFGNANLFLINPAGFLFGPSATVNVGGMVAFSTADYLRFQGTDTLFNNASTTASLSPLSIAPVVAFGFLGSNPAAIAIQGSTLKVADGQSLSLVGGNQGFTATDPDTGNPIPVSGGITMTGGKLLAPGGRINIASVAGPGEISVVDFMPSSGLAMGNISLSEEALIDVSANAGGAVKIRAGQLVVNQATISADTADADGAPVAIDINVTGAVSLSRTNLPALTARTLGAGNAGDILINSGSLTSTFSLTEFGSSLIDTHSMGAGHGGNVTISTGPLSMIGDPLHPGFFIDTGTGADGGSGNVTITASDAHFEFGGINTGDNIFFGAGNGGNLTIKANSLTLDTVSFGADAFSARAGALTFDITGLLQISGNSFLSNISLLGANPITIKADRFVMNDGPVVLSGTMVASGGDTSVTARIIELSNGGAIATQTIGDGKAGDIHITGSEHVSLLDNQSATPFRPSGFFTQSVGDPTLGAHGSAGSITIDTPRLELSGGARLNSSTQTSGNGGDIILHTGSISITGQRTFDILEGQFDVGSAKASGLYTGTSGHDLCAGVCGNAGNIDISTLSLTLESGGRIDSGSSNSGNGGTITVMVNGQASLSGTTIDGTPGGIFSRTTGTNPDAGSGGNILLKAGSIAIQNGAQLSASSLGPGAAGNVTVEGTASPAQSVLIDGSGSGIFTTTSGSGPGGNITIDTNAVNLTNGASITASSTGTGNTGNINTNAGNQFTMANSSVTTEATQSGGGIIKITTNPNGTVQLTNSTISASVLDGNGGGGSVNIDPQSVVLINSQILANAVFGPGGNINITTNLLLPDSASVISASSQFGQQGTITVQSPISPASGKIVPLSQKPLVATTLLSQRCAALAGGDASSFTLAGRDSLPAEPGAWLSAPLASSASESGNRAAAEASPHISVSGTSDDMPLLSLRKIAPPGFLTQSFAPNGSTDCTS